MFMLPEEPIRIDEHAITLSTSLLFAWGWVGAALPRRPLGSAEPLAEILRTATTNNQRIRTSGPSHMGCQHERRWSQQVQARGLPSRSTRSRNTVVCVAGPRVSRQGCKSFRPWQEATFCHGPSSRIRGRAHAKPRHCRRWGVGR